MITEALAEFVANQPTDEIPDDAFDAATDALIDVLGVALAGSREPIADIVAGWIDEIGARPKATVWGRGLATHGSEAAFANAISAHALDFDDTHPGGRGHMSVCLVPPLLALGEELGSSGKELLAAYVIGLETAGAIGRAFGPGHLHKGWHPTATVGSLAATAAVARLSGFNAEQVTRAFGNAASQMSGLARNFGTMTKPSHAGHAARTGYVSAWMAKNDLTANATIFDDKGGVLDTFGGGDGEPIEEILANLGNPWEILTPGNYYKRWPCCYSGHRTIGALYGLIDEHAIRADEVDEVTVSFLPGGDTALLSRDPQTGLEAKFSIEYVVAAALLDGPIKMASFADTMVQRPEIRQLMQRVRRTYIPDEKFYSGIVGYNDIAVTMPRGRFEIREDRVPGSFAWPTSEKDRDAKFMDCARFVLDEAEAAELLDTIKSIRSTGDVGILAKATVPRGLR
jgi:2-methylcitrate dehydratase PrpD